ncbi:tRNA guanosine(34) transglycosylase Tgt [Oenococcus alcoholitolerans]|uniref:Queuine tRNA-ribosyltransferase n=1 Tax=Oenococcus alcoholitolerans TaxID=931074 RepID=A0ABR4XQG9_9LACO|nr:queuine tRNA-ribosyltransferase [Oenococcus alcoholitolerans]
MTKATQAVTYELLHVDKHTGARRGIIHTPHGDWQTPMFMPVGTQATVKSVQPRELKEIGAQFILGNTYHLWLRPGDELIAAAGGLHKFMDWNGPILTDSGGFQVFSLADSRSISEKGVTFKNNIDGSTMFLSPEVAIKIQNNLGSDVIMQLDEAAPYFESFDYLKESSERSVRWAERALKAHKNKDKQALFGIVQGAGFYDLRKNSAKNLVSLDLPGYAIGGLSVGESKKEMNRVLDFTTQWLPTNKARYLMGVGAPDSLIDCVNAGIDMFDCVLPTRIARKGSLMTRFGRIVITNHKYKNDFSQLDPDLDDYASTHFTKAYLHHLFNTHELLGYNLASIHNLRFLLKLMEDMRQAIENDQMVDFRKKVLDEYGYNRPNARLF